MFLNAGSQNASAKDKFFSVHWSIFLVVWYSFSTNTVTVYWRQQSPFGPMLAFWEVELIFMLQHQQTLFLSFHRIKEKCLFLNTKNLTIYRNPKTKRFLDEVHVIGPQWSCTTCNVVNIDGLDIRFSTPVYFFCFVFFSQQNLFLWRAIFSTNPILSRQRYFFFCLNDSSWFFCHFFFRLLRLPNLLLTLISLHVVGRHGNTTRRLVAVSFLCKLRKYRNYTETANNNCQGIISLSFYEKVDFSTVKYSFPLFMIKRLSACRLNFQCILSSF